MNYFSLANSLNYTLIRNNCDCCNLIMFQFDYPNEFADTCAKALNK